MLKQTFGDNAEHLHSDINLTMNVYSHVNMEEQEAAIAVLPAPPEIAVNGKPKRRKSRT